jgi:hypothetical protein
MLSLAHNCVFISLSETSTSLMASSEVNVHVEEVVVVTTPDGAGEGSAAEVKTVLVATELTQPG